MTAPPRPHDARPRAIGETYFFRDHGQFDLLRLRLLPELVERRRDARSLRLWSAGCASGEEAYSLAMLVDMVLPERDGWNIHIVGSDIDAAALAKAQRGRYGPWSFRMAPAGLKQRYFERSGDEWVLDERIRRMVSFRALDLVGAAFPDGETHDLDLILCRNVFIYFAPATVAAVAAKLAASLSEGGYLMAGHTELIGHRIGNMRSRLFAEGVVYQRFAAEPGASSSSARLPSPSAAAATSPTAAVSSARSFAVAAPRPVNGPAAGVFAPACGAASSADDLLAAARQLADRGDYEQAAQVCRRALAMAPLAAEGHFLLAQLAQLGGEFEEAGQLLAKTLYLDPDKVAAYLELAALCERGDKLARARALRRAALDIVRALPGDTRIEPYETTAAAMAQWLADR